MKLVMCIAVLLVTLFPPSAMPAETIYLSIAASMTDAFREILSGFSATHPDETLQPNFGSSGSLAKQIVQGAPADIYVSANPKWTEYLAEKSLIAPRFKRVFAYNTLVFVGIEEGADLTLAGLVNLERIAIGSPDSVPAGQYARQAMIGAGIYETLERDRKLVMAKDVRQALLYADRGEVDGAFVYRTDAPLATQAHILFAVPEELYDRVAYPVALTNAGAAKERARDFYLYLSSPEVAEILSKHGFEPPR
ncbi:MAG: molybdate ABC transporter substrate-binding protein [Desulforhopalus sp.]